MTWTKIVSTELVRAEYQLVLYLDNLEKNKWYYISNNTIFYTSGDVRN